jgi:hypothetical protein
MSRDNNALPTALGFFTLSAPRTDQARMTC